MTHSKLTEEKSQRQNLEKVEVIFYKLGGIDWFQDFNKGSNLGEPPPDLACI